MGGEFELYSISDLARKLNVAYPHVHSAVNGLISQNILKANKIGRSIYCSLNLANDLCRNLLEFSLIETKQKIFKKPNLKNLNKDILNLVLEFPEIISVIFKKNKLIFIISNTKIKNNILKKSRLPEILFATTGDFKKQLLRTNDLLEGITIFGYDRLLLLLNDLHDRLIVKHSSIFKEVTK